MKAKKGFTLIELLIVIVIIGILATIVVGIVGSSARKKANDAKKKSTVHEIQNALEQYFVDKDEYPGALADLADATITDPILLKTAPGAAYIYTTGTPVAGKIPSYTLSFVLENQGEAASADVIDNGGTKSFTVTSKQ